jgi:hypothetical protein
MTTDATRLPAAGSPTSTSSTFARLARTEAGRYARHPLFLIGLLATIVLTALPGDETAVRTTQLLDVLVPALFIGVLGIVTMYRITRTSDRLAEASGAPATSLRTRTAALAAAVAVPFAVGLAWFTFAVVRYQNAVTPPDGLPFGGVGDGWAYGLLFALGAVSCAGGPIIGLDLARWFPRRGIAVITAVGLVIAVMIMQGNIEALRYIRVFMPFTWFGGPIGVEGDDMRMVILTGSPQWYAAYLVSLCVLGLLVALYRDREQPRHRLRVAIIVTGVVAVGLCLLAMTQGVQAELINPVATAVSGS